MPTFSDGSIALCHVHQKAVLLHGSMNSYLVSLTQKLARDARDKNKYRCPHCKSYRAWLLNKARHGSHYRFKCGDCQRRWGLIPRRPLSASTYEQLFRLIESGAKQVDICRIAGVQKNTVVRAQIALADRKLRQ